MSDKRVIHLVDDEDAIRRSAGFLLRTAGFEVMTYASGTEFLAAVGQVVPGCILLDIRMPGIDGLEVQRLLGERGVGLPVIVLTGHGDITLSVRAIKAGAVDFLEKPFEKAALLHAIDEAFARLADTRALQLDASEAMLRLAALTHASAMCSRGSSRGRRTRSPPTSLAYRRGRSRRIART